MFLLGLLGWECNQAKENRHTHVNSVEQVPASCYLAGVLSILDRSTIQAAPRARQNDRRKNGGRGTVWQSLTTDKVSQITLTLKLDLKVSQITLTLHLKVHLLKCDDHEANMKVHLSRWTQYGRHTAGSWWHFYLYENHDEQSFFVTSAIHKDITKSQILFKARVNQYMKSQRNSGFERQTPGSPVNHMPPQKIFDLMFSDRVKHSVYEHRKRPAGQNPECIGCVVSTGLAWSIQSTVFVTMYDKNSCSWMIAAFIITLHKFKSFCVSCREDHSQYWFESSVR